MLDLVTLLGYVLPAIFIALIIYVGLRLNRRNQVSAEGVSSDLPDRPDLEFESIREVSEVEEPVEDARKNVGSETPDAGESVLDESLGNVVDELRQAFEAVQPLTNDSSEHDEASMTGGASTPAAEGSTDGPSKEDAANATKSELQCELQDAEEAVHREDLDEGDLDEGDLDEEEIVVIGSTDEEQESQTPSTTIELKGNLEVELEDDLFEEARRLQQAADDDKAGQVDKAGQEEPASFDQSMQTDKPDDPDEPTTNADTARASGTVKSSIPPRRSASPMPFVASKKSVPKQTPEELLARSIPPRRPKPIVTPSTMGSSPKTGTPSDSSGVPQPQVADSTMPPTRPFVPIDLSADAAVEEELAELRLALEASYHELTHLTASRDQALSLANRHEAETQHLQQQVADILAEQTQLQRDRAALQKLVDDLKHGTSSLQQELSDAKLQAESAQTRLEQAPPAEAIEQMKSRHNAAMDELRSILGQREAAEASLRRERDSLAEVNLELERRLERLSQEAEATAEGQLQADTQPAVDAAAMAEAANRVADSEAQVRQLNADLSLANESIRQLNQNLSFRDSQLHGLRQEKDQLARELEEERERRRNEPLPSLKDTDEFKAALTAAMSSLESERDRIAAALEATESELAAVSSVHDETTRRLQRLEQDWQQERAQAVEELQQARNAVEADRVELQERLAAMQSELSVVDRQRDELRQRLAAVETELGTTNAALQAAQQELLSREQDDTAERQLAVLQSSLSDANAERDDARGQVETLQNALEHLQSKLSETQHAFEAMQREQHQRQLEDERRQQDTVGQVASLQFELDAATNELLTSKSELSTALDGLTDAQAELEKLRRELQSSNAEVKAAHAELKAVSSELAAVTSELGESQQHHDGLIKATEVELDEIRCALKEADSARDLANQKLADTQRELKAVIESKSALADEIAALRADLADRQGVEGEAQVRVASLEAKVAELEQVHAAQLQELTELRQELASSSRYLAEHSEFKTALADAAKQLEQLQGELELQQQLQIGLQAEKQVQLDQIGAFQEEINFKAEEMRRLHDRLAAAEKRSHLLEQKASDVDSARQQTKELTAALAQAKAELKRVQLEQIDAKHELALLSEASDAWDAERLHLFARLGLDEHGKPLDQDAGDASGERDIDAIREQLAEARQAADEARAAAALQQSELDVLQQRYRERGDALESLTSQNREYRRSVANLHAIANELEELKLDRVREQESARLRLQEAVAANADLSGDLAAVRKKVTELTEQLAAAKSSPTKKAAKRASGSTKSTSPRKAAKASTRETSETASTSKANSSDKAAGEIVFDERPDAVDDLKQISGVGPAIEKRLNGAGIYQFQQIANWSTETAERLTKELSLGIRVKRDRWISQAQKLTKKSNKKSE